MCPTILRSTIVCNIQVINGNSLCALLKLSNQDQFCMTRDRTDNGMLQGHGSHLSVRVCYCEEYSVLKIRRK